MNMKRKLKAFLEPYGLRTAGILVMLVMLGMSSARATEVTISTDDAAALKSALEGASKGDVINVTSNIKGVGTITITTDITLNIADDCVIEGDG